MLDWLKDRLRRWLAKEPPLSMDIACYVPSGAGPRLETFIATEVVGVWLLAVSKTGSEVRLIGNGEALDQEHFWRLWRRLSPPGDGLAWEDGSPFSPV